MIIIIFVLFSFPDPSCVKTYDPVVTDVNLAVYCANYTSSSQGACRCFSGICGTCRSASQSASVIEVQRLVCNSRYSEQLIQTL
jgi:hypothetical protein